MKKNLCIVLYHNPTSEVRGKTRRYLYEIRPNVFVGTVSISVRDCLWKEIGASQTEACLIYPDCNEQGFSYRSTSEVMQRFVPFDGILMPAKKCVSISVSDLYAKPTKKLLDHLLEAGTISEMLMTYGVGHHAIQVMAKRFNIEEKELVGSIAFLSAIHDIGKAHPGFQKHLAETSNEEMSDTILSLILNGMIVPEDTTVRHERYSAEIVKKYLTDCGMEKKQVEKYTTIIAYHHQGKSKDRIILEKVGCFRPEDNRWNEWNRIHLEIIEEIEKHWKFAESMTKIAGKNGINGLSYLILSIMVTADWIVSGFQWSTYPRFGRTLENSARDFLNKNMLSTSPIEDIFKGLQWKDVFSFPKNALQEAISKENVDYADLILIEYPCGYGKTEAALLAALKFGVKKSGIYIAAPTMSTAKGLAKRCQRLAEKIELGIPIPELDSSMVWSNEDMSKIPKELWISRTRHQFLYPFAVGTIDQVLKTVDSYRYSCIGILGLSDKVVIIDEVHAYDAYMLTELKNLIIWCRFFQVPVIMLSATLSTKTRKILFNAAGCKNVDIEAQIENIYPMVSMVSNKELVQVYPKCEGRIMPVSCIKTGDADGVLYEKAMQLNVGCMALITATVEDAFSLYHRLKKDKEDFEVLLFQGRDTVAGKTRKTQELLRLLGKDRSNRPKKLIVVTTSIIEQSLDVDFDYIVTVLAPIDLLIQRLGRLWRHTDVGTIREDKVIEYPFTIVIPEQYGKLGWIYDSNILDATEIVLQGLDRIDTVMDVRKLIDGVYKTDIRSEGKSQMKAGTIILDSPFYDEITIVSNEEDAYRKFDRIIPVTREEKYPTVQIAILESLKDDYSYEEMQRIMFENVISVPKEKVELFTNVHTDMKYFHEIQVFIGKGLSVEENGNRMILTEDGLEFYLI